METRKEKVRFPQAYKITIWAMNLWIELSKQKLPGKGELQNYSVPNFLYTFMSDGFLASSQSASVTGKQLTTSV